MDNFTRQHLLNWVESKFIPEEQESAFNTIADFIWFADDQEYWTSKGWWRVYDAAMRSASAD